MERISFHIAKKEGQVTVRYRLRQGDDVVQICHRSDIRCDIKDLMKLNPDGTPKDRVRVYNQALSEALKKEYDIMVLAFAKMRDEGMDMTSEVFEREISAIKNPVVGIRLEAPNVVTRFRQYADDALRAGIIGASRHKHIIVVSDKLERFLLIKGMSGMTAEEFDVADLVDFREFIFEEYQYVQKYPLLYRKVKEQNKPSARLSMNTVSSQLKMFQTFFAELEDLEEIRKSPFRKLGKEKRRALMRTKYDEPFFLRKEELFRILETEVGPALKGTKDAFLVQCAFGCRVSDFAMMSMETIAVTDGGIPYIHYIPSKTDDAEEYNTEVKTPIIRYAYDIIMRTRFSFPILRNVFGVSGYNARIKSLLQQCKIDRLVAQYNEETKRNEYLPLYKVGSSKLARKTHVDMMNKVQVDKYAAGLHKVGSTAVERYTNMEIKDRFILMNAAFGQEDFRVDMSLSIIDNN